MPRTSQTYRAMPTLDSSEQSEDEHQVTDRTEGETSSELGDSDVDIQVQRDRQVGSKGKARKVHMSDFRMPLVGDNSIAGSSRSNTNFGSSRSHKQLNPPPRM